MDCSIVTCGLWSHGLENEWKHETKKRNKRAFELYLRRNRREVTQTFSKSKKKKKIEIEEGKETAFGELERPKESPNVAQIC